MPETDTPTAETDQPATPVADAIEQLNTDATDAKDTKDTATGDLGDSGKNAIVAEREARKHAERQLRDVQKALKEYEDRDKSELQKALERAEAAEKSAAEATFSALRSKVAATKGVPASSLTGATEEELAASADELIAWRDQNKPATPPPTKRAPTSGSGLKSGATNSETTNHDPKAVAAEAVRRLRSGG
jgi:hypothetical protein